LTQLSILALGPAASLLLAHVAHAQAGACDQLKAALAARIDPSIRGFALEVVPAGAPVPPGAKVIGNCEGGARKILFFRSGGTQLPLDAARAVAPAPRASAALAETKPRVVAVQPAPVAQPVAVPIEKPQPEPPATKAAPSVSKPNVETPALAASASAVVQIVERAAEPPAQAQLDRAPTASASIAQQASEFGGRHWPWLAALGLLMLGGSLWAWLAHHRAYDAAGLPRGPRIN
jgi:hypothetical protein